MQERNKPAFITGEYIITATDVPEQLPDEPIPDGYFVVIKARYENQEFIYIGNSAIVTKWSMGPWDWVRLKVTNLNEVWVKGKIGDGTEYITEV